MDQPLSAYPYSYAYGELPLIPDDERSRSSRVSSRAPTPSQPLSKSPEVSFFFPLNSIFSCHFVFVCSFLLWAPKSGCAYWVEAL